MGKLDRTVQILALGWIAFVIVGSFVYSVVVSGFFQTFEDLFFGTGFRGQQYISP